MECYCNSCKLYQNDYLQPSSSFILNNTQLPQKRAIDHNIMQTTHQNDAISYKIQQSSETWLPAEIQTISWDEIEFNPMWFYKKFISKNIPCVITGALEGDDIFERWSETQYLSEVLENQQQSISLTPDGFADSIKNRYFVEPYEEKANIKHFLEREEFYPDAVPYIQHQNNNLSEEFPTLGFELPTELLKGISQNFFKGSNPEATNIWMGYDESVSALHKDFYQNFYLTVVGEKHFTLLPPTSVLWLEEQDYQMAQWEYHHQKQKGEPHFTCQTQKEGLKNKWICVNPDLKQDHEQYPSLKNNKQYHVVLEKQQMLYLPSIWYHQVSQTKKKDPYTLAINYWFDMDFDHKFTLYEACRGLRGYNL